MAATTTDGHGASALPLAAEDFALLFAHAMEAIAAPAFVTDQDGIVLFTNGAARGLLAEHLHGTLSRLARAARGDEDTGFSVARVGAPGGRRHCLVVGRDEAREQATTGEAVEAATSAWSLSKRQAEVLALVAEGHPNATIAQLLGIALRTVEVHVTSLLARAGVENRSSLVARTLGFGQRDRVRSRLRTIV